MNTEGRSEACTQKDVVKRAQQERTLRLAQQGDQFLGWHEKKVFLASRCRGQEIAGGQLTWQSSGHKNSTMQSQYCATSPSAPWGAGALSRWSARSPGAG